MKLRFKPDGKESRMSGSNVTHKDWEILRDGEVVGKITSTIRDLNQSYTNPGYGVTVNAELFGTEHQFHRSSGSNSNTSMERARSTRSAFFGQTKEWVLKKIEAM